MKRLVLVGGGHAHVEVLRRLGRTADPQVRATLISPRPTTPYSGMMPGLIAGHYSYDQMHIDLPSLARYAGAEFVSSRVTRIALADNNLECDDGTQVDYDLVSLDIGSVPRAIPGAKEHAVTVRPLGRFLDAWDACIATAPLRQPPGVIVVGGGAAGVELILAMQYRMRKSQRATATFLLVADTPHILPAFSVAARAAFERLLHKRGIEVVTGHAVEEIRSDAIRYADGALRLGSFIVLATTPSAPAWLARDGLACDGSGFVLVDKSLRSVSHAAVFAAGDCASLRGHGVPKSGVFAVRQGPVLAANLRAALLGQPLAPYDPQRRSLALISAGNRYAVAARGEWMAEGAWVWHWKDWVDRRFVRRYARLKS